MAGTKTKPEAGSAADPREPKTRVRASVLRGALRDVGGIVEGRNTIPILSTVLLRVQDQVITLTASDLDHQAVRTCASDDRDGPDSKAWLDSIRGFAVCLPAKPLEAVLGELDGDAMVTIAAGENGRATVSAGKARFRFPTLPWDEFPMLSAFAVEHDFTMPCTALADALGAVDHAISTEETRYYLNGVCLHPQDLDLRFAATDGHRLARWTVDAPIGAASSPTVIVARKTVAVLGRLLAGAIKAAGDSRPAEVQVEMSADGRILCFALDAEEDGTVELIAKAIDGTFPDYMRVIPPAPEHRITVNKAQLGAVVKRVGLVSSAKSRAVRVEIVGDVLTVSAASPEIGEASEDLACSYDGPGLEGGALALGFDGKYLREALAPIGSELVALRTRGATDDAVRISGWDDQAREETGALLQVLMPVRV